MEYRTMTPEPMAYSLVRPTQPGGDGPSSRFKLMVTAFCQLIMVMATFVALMTGLLLLSESGEDMRGHGVSQYYRAVQQWNDEARASFAAADPVKLGPMYLSADVHDSMSTTWLETYDTNPSDLLDPAPLQFSGELSFGSALPGQDWSAGDPLNPMVEVDISVSGTPIPTVTLPRRFSENHCEWVQRGKWNRQVCKWYFFVLQGVCVKLGEAAVGWEASKQVIGLQGATSGFGCYMYGGPGNRDDRATNLWSAGVYKRSLERVDALETVPVHVRSNADPGLVVDQLTNGSYDFGPGQAVKFMWGLILTITASLVLFSFCFCLFIQYTWPQANTNSDRIKYFYRRYLRKHHMWCRRTCASMFSSGTATHWNEEDASNVADDDHEDSDWAGPRTGGYTLGRAPPTLHDPAQAPG